MPDPVQTNGTTSAAAALQMLERRQQVLANNLANVSTRGFKAETPFARMLGTAAGNSVATTDTTLDLAQGTLTETHNALDLAVQGDGFFVVKTPAGERFVRNGSFKLDAARTLVDEQGNAVMGDGGPITIPQGTIEIDNTGMLKVNGKPQQRLRLERVTDASNLQHEGGTLFVPDATRVAIAPEQRAIKQGFVEESNVNPMTAMTDMLSVLHRYGAAQKTLSTIDEVRGIAVTELARPA